MKKFKKHILWPSTVSARSSKKCMVRTKDGKRCKKTATHRKGTRNASCKTHEKVISNMKKRLRSAVNRRRVRNSRRHRQGS